MSYKECEHCFGTGLDHGGCEHDLRIEKLETALKQIRDPELADSIIKALRSDVAEVEKRIEMLTYSLERIRDIDWLQYSNRIDAIQQIAREALK